MESYLIGLFVAQQDLKDLYEKTERPSKKAQIERIQTLLKRQWLAAIVFSNDRPESRPWQTLQDKCNAIISRAVEQGRTCTEVWLETDTVPN